MLNKIIKLINIILENRGGGEVKIINNATHLRNDLNFDSLDLAELTVRIEAEYDMDIFEDGIVNTVGDIIKKIESK